MTNPKARKRPNLFVLLDIDPDAPWTAEYVAERLSRKRPEWSSDSQGTGPKAHKAKVALDYFTELEPVAKDRDMLAVEAEQAICARNVEKEAKRARFYAELASATLRGNLYDTEVDRWRTVYADVVSMIEIEAAINVPVHHEATSNNDQYLNPLTWKEIQDDLDLLGYESLYELLQLFENASTSELLLATDALRKSTMKTMKKTAFVDAQGRLAGRAKQVFDDEPKRQKHDATLKRERVRRTAEPFQHVWAADGIIHGAQADALVEQVRARYGISNEDALTELKALAYERKWIVLSSRDDRREKELEEQVGVLQEQNKQIEALRKEYESAKGDKRKIERQLRLAEVAQRDAEQALFRARQDLEASLAIQRRREGIEKERRRQGITQRQSRIVELMGQCQYFQAQRELESVAPPPIEWTDLARTIAGHIESAQRKLNEAKAERDIGRAEQLAREALDEVADFEPAKKWFKERAPAAPRNLRVVVNDGVARLTWDPSGSVDVRYVVVRTIDAPARSWLEGHRIGETADLLIVDTDIPPGEQVYYAAYARRGELYSNSSALITEPVMSVPDVTHLRKEVDDATIVLSWTPPAGVRRVSVTRWEGAHPEQGIDGMPVSLTGVSSLCDSGLVNGQRYEYLVQCVYGGGLTEHRSVGVRLTATLSALPTVAPTLHLYVTNSRGDFGQRVRFEASTLDHGDLKVLKCSGRIPAVGEKLPEEEVSRLGRLIPMPEGDTLIASTVVTYVPVVIVEGRALVGEAVRHVWVEDVRNLTADVQGERIRLEWRWPLLVNEAEIHALNDGKSSEKTLVARVVRKLGETSGAYEVSAEQRHYPEFVVLASAILEGKRMTAQGVRVAYPIGSPTVGSVVTYGFRSTRRPLGGRHRKVMLQSNGIRALPPLVVRVKHGAPPKDRNDGRFLEALRNVEVSTTELELPLRADGIEPNTYGAVFVEDEQSSGKLLLRPMSLMDQKMD